MTITGLYKTDNNFTTVFCNNTMYDIAGTTGEWNCVAVGARMVNGFILTQEAYNTLKSKCKKTGTFDLEE